MGRKLRIPFIWKLTIVCIVVAAAVISLFYLQIPPKAANLARYQQAKICQDAPTCRQTQTVTVLQSQTKMATFNVRTKFGQSQHLADIQYYFKVNLDGHQIESNISPRISVDRYSFDVPNVFTDFFNENAWAEINLPQGKKIKVEFWENQITFVFLNVMGHSWPDGNTYFSTPDPNQSDPTAPSTGKTLFFAIPTADHPVIALKKAQQDLFGVSIGAIIILGLLIMLALRFRKPFWPSDAPNHRNRTKI